MKRIFAVAVLSLLIGGCDRIAYEAKNNPITEGVENAYKSLNRVPLEARWSFCKSSPEWENKIYLCMKDGGYIQNPEFEKEVDRCMAPHMIYQSTFRERMDALHGCMEADDRGRTKESGFPLYIPG